MRSPSLSNAFRRAPNWWVLLGYGLLTLVFTYPLAWHIGTAMPGQPPDVFIFIWNLEWTRHAIFDLGTNPYITTAMYYPTGVPLYFHTLAVGNTFLALPIQFLLGAPAAFTGFTLASFVLSGYGAYLLAYNCVRRRGPAFFAGMVFTFAPYHLAHLNYSHFNLIALQWLPFFALSAKLYLERPNVKRLLLATIFLCWISLTDWYYALYAALFLGLLTAYRMLRVRSLAPLAAVLVLGGLYLLFLSPLFIGTASELGGGAVDPLRALKEASRFSGDLLGFVTPSTLHPLWGKLVEPVASRLHGGLAERTIFYGFVPLLLAVWGVIQYRKPDVFFWGVVALVFSLLALGPTLFVLGESEFGESKAQIVMPSALLYQIPVISTVFNIARSISRYSLIAMMSIAVLSAYGLAAIVANLNSRKSAAVIGAACVLVGIEFAVVPVPVTPIYLPPSIETLRSMPKPFATLNLPTELKSGGEAMYFWTQTHIPTTNGYHSQLFDFPILDGLEAMRGLSHPDPRDIVLEPKPTPAQALRFFDIKYVVLHKLASEAPPLVQASQEWIENTLKAGAPIAQDERVAVYGVPDAVPPPLLVMLDTSRSGAPTIGWDPAVESFGDERLWRWMHNDASVLIYANAPERVEVSFTPISFSRPRQLEIYFNDALILTETIASDEIEPLRFPIDLEAGKNELRFHSVEPPEQPSALGLNADERYLSIGFSELSLKSE